MDIEVVDINDIYIEKAGGSARKLVQLLESTERAYKKHGDSYLESFSIGGKKKKEKKKKTKEEDNLGKKTYNLPIHCLSCNQNTENGSCTLYRSKDKKSYRISCVCAKCGTNKSTFIGKATVEELQLV